VESTAIMIKRCHFLPVAVFATMVGAGVAFDQDWAQAATVSHRFGRCGSYLPDPDAVETCLRRQEGRASNLYMAPLDQHAGAASSTRQKQPGAAPVGLDQLAAPRRESGTINLPPIFRSPPFASEK
jgi:hypothetical protein